MTDRHPVTGRFVTTDQWLAAMVQIRDRERRQHRLQDPVPDPRRFPTARHPRYRLRVFGLCWPWRASRREAVRDALASGNARFDRDDRVAYLDACAAIQQDPPLHRRPPG